MIGAPPDGAAVLAVVVGGGAVVVVGGTVARVVVGATVVVGANVVLGGAVVVVAAVVADLAEHPARARAARHRRMIRFMGRYLSVGDSSMHLSRPASTIHPSNMCSW